MCYDIKTKLETQLKRAKHYGYDDLVAELIKKLRPFWEEEEIFHASGFAHPTLAIYTTQSPEKPTLAQWGLVPFWVKTKEDQRKIWNQTINARGESIWEKPSFRAAAKSKRCIVHLDGFFEHHHKNGKAFPYFIHPKDGEPLPIAGLWDEWTDRKTGEILHTFTIVTTQANKLLSEIHNNPKLKEPRMPLILPDGTENEWLTASPEEAKKLIKPFVEKELEAYTVRPLRGKGSVGNQAKALEPYVYDELNTLF